MQIDPEDAEAEGVPLLKALGIVVPGRVTRRFAPYQAGLSHWIPIDVTQEHPIVNLEQNIMRYEPLDIEVGDFCVVRPLAIRMERVPPFVSERSNARWHWTTRIEAGPGPLDLAVPQRGPWGGAIHSLQGYLYRDGSPVYVARFARGGSASISVRRADHRVAFELCLHDRPAAIGFEQEVDGLRIEIASPSLDALINATTGDVAVSSRSLLFRALVQDDDRLAHHANVFQLDWLAQAFLAASVSFANERGTTFADACRHVPDGRIDDGIRMLFPAIELHPSGDPDDTADGDERDTATAAEEQRLVHALRELIRIPDVPAILRGHGDTAGNPSSEIWGNWLRTLMFETLGAAFGDAAASALPDNSATENLLVDWTQNEDGMTVWLTEQTLGGAGVVESLIALASAEPRKFFRAVDAALAPSDLERASDALGFLCRRIREDEAVADLAERCAAARGHLERADLLVRVAEVLQAHGFAAGSTFGVSANARLFRPGMGRELWSLLADLDEERVRLQHRTGVIVDLRVFCTIAEADPVFGPRLERALARVRPGRLRGGEAAQLLAGMLWPQAAEIRAAERGTWNPFREGKATERELVRAVLARPQSAIVDVMRHDWQRGVADALTKNGVAHLVADATGRQTLAHALLTLAVEPIDAGWLLLYAAVERIERREDRWTAVLYLREVA